MCLFPVPYTFFFKSSPKDMFIDFRERKGETPAGYLLEVPQLQVKCLYKLLSIFYMGVFLIIDKDIYTVMYSRYMSLIRHMICRYFLIVGGLSLHILNIDV